MYPKEFVSKGSFAEVPGTVFVLMPFAAEFDAVYENIKQTIEGNPLSMSCYRADELYGSVLIMEDILRGIFTSQLVIADLTSRNPNVFYELGVAHTAKDQGKCVLLTQSMADVPFDLRHLRCIVYDNSMSGAKKLPRDLIKAIQAALSI